MGETYWTKVLFREFIAHYITKNAEEKAKDVEQSIIALTTLNASGDSFGAKMVESAKLRMEEKAAKASAENGRMGGRPPKDDSKPPGSAGKMPTDKDVIYDFAIENNLDTMDAYECWVATMERKGRDANGNKITNWKGFVIQWCNTRKANRNKD